MTTQQQDLVWADSQIGKGLKPLAQHGTVVVGGDGTFTLYGTQGDVIDSAPIGEVKAKRMGITGGQTVSLRIQDRKYNVTPGWGSSLTHQGTLFATIGASKALVKAIESQGQVPTA